LFKPAAICDLCQGIDQALLMELAVQQTQIALRVIQALLHLAQAKCRLFPEADSEAIYREYGLESGRD